MPYSHQVEFHDPAGPLPLMTVTGPGVKLFALPNTGAESSLVLVDEVWRRVLPLHVFVLS